MQVLEYVSVCVPSYKHLARRDVCVCECESNLSMCVYGMQTLLTVQTLQIVCVCVRVYVWQKQSASCGCGTGPCVYFSRSPIAFLNPIHSFTAIRVETGYRNTIGYVQVFYTYIYIYICTK